jgi:hypothetical protein
MLKRVAGFADAVEIVGATFSISSRFVGHAFLGYLVTVSWDIFASCRWIRTPHIGICESGRLRVADGDAGDVAVVDVIVVDDVVACDEEELAMLVACVQVVVTTEVLDGVLV